MRYPILFLFLAVLVSTCIGCSTKGPGADCDDCAVAEASAPGANSQAAAASAAGGQRANQAPFSGEQGARIDPTTTVGRGSGATTASSADNEHRATASGGAQNIALLNPATAVASTGGGGVSVDVQEKQKTLATFRAALMVAMTANPVDMAKVDFISTKLAAADAALSAATSAAAGQRPNVTHNYHMDGDNTLVGYSRAGNGEGPDSPAAMKTLDEAARNVLKKPAASSADLPKPAGTAEGGE